MGLGAKPWKPEERRRFRGLEDEKKAFESERKEFQKKKKSVKKQKEG